MQSPINIDSPDDIRLDKTLTLKFTNLSNNVTATVLNTGKTLKSTLEWMDMEFGIEGNIMKLHGTSLHFKAPSEHTINGNHYSLVYLVYNISIKEMQIASKNLN